MILGIYDGSRVGIEEKMEDKYVRRFRLIYRRFWMVCIDDINLFCS